MQVTLKQKRGNQWHESQINAADLDQYQGQDAVALIADGYVWVGNEKWRSYYDKKGYDTTTTVALMDWMDKAAAIFRENREERQAICSADKVPQAEINEIFKQYPLLYDN